MDYDIAVIGGGPGGYVAAIKAAQMGKKTVLIEKKRLGGTCLNEGCIPTKILLRSAEALKGVKEAVKFGVAGFDGSGAALDLTKVQERKELVVFQLTDGVKGLLTGNGVDLIEGEGLLKDRNTVEIGEQRITAEYIILAVGSVPKNLPAPISPRMEVLTSAEALNLCEIPESMAVVGGGVIGIELAYFLAEIGTKVTVIEFLDRILPMVDEEITEQVTSQLVSMGIAVYTGAEVTEITEDSVVFQQAGTRKEVKVQTVLTAVGREANLSGIPTQELGIATQRGAVVTDQTMRTSVSNIYAIGDVNGKVMLAHTASMEGVIAVENICGYHREMDYDKIPSVVYIQPEVASIGLTEKQAGEKYEEVRVGRFPLMANGKAKAAGEERGFIKVVVDGKYGEIVGVHLYCMHAADLIAEAAAAMTLEGTAREMTSVVHPHPSISEAIHEAFHGAVDQTIHYI